MELADACARNRAFGGVSTRRAGRCPCYTGSRCWLQSNMTTRHQPKKCVFYVQYTNPQCYPPLENSARIFVAEGWRVVFLGVESEGDTKCLAFADSGNVDVQLLPRWGSRSLIKLHFLWFMLRCLLRILAIRPSVIYLSNQYSTPLGALLTYISSKPIVYHEHDHPGECPSSLNGKI